jgi:hypothetical protein
MKFNDRSMALLGIPDLPADAFKHVGNYKIVPQGGGGSGGGGQAQPQQTTVQNTNVPEYARPYVETMLGTAQQQIYNYDRDASGNMVPTSMRGYTPYSQTPSDYFAPFSPLQNQAMGAAGQLGTSPELDMASNLAGAAGQRAMNTQYQSQDFGNQFQAPQDYQTGRFGAQQVNAPNLQQYQMGPAERVRAESFNQPGTASQYMDPFMQNVVDVQQREAQRQADIAGTQRSAQAARSGAFGGSRAGLLEAEAARNLALQKGDIQAAGQSAAFQNAQQQFNAEQNARMQAQLANQGAGLTVGQQNLASQLQTQGLGSGQNLQAQLANQQQGMNAQQMREQSRQFGAGQGMTAAQQRAQYGLAGQQAGEQSRQFGANMGLQGLQTGMQAAGQLGTLGQNRYAQQTGNIGLQNQLGAQQQAQQQRYIDQMIQNYGTAQQYPQQQLAFMSGLLRGLPLQTATTQQYQAAPSSLSQVAGLGMAGYGLSRMPGMKKGGKVKAPQRTAGLAELALSKMA